MKISKPMLVTMHWIVQRLSEKKEKKETDVKLGQPAQSLNHLLSGTGQSKRPQTNPRSCNPAKHDSTRNKLWSQVVKHLSLHR